jgi:DNA-binding IclR family transcriptional regulator
MDDKLKTPSLPSVPRALEVLDYIAASQGGASLTQLTRSLGVPRSTMYCLLLTLERSGHIRRTSARGPYFCGPKLVELSGKTLAGSGLRAIAMPILRSLMQRTKLVAHLAILDQEQVRIVAQIAPADGSLTTSVGQHLELYCTALGKAIATFLPESQVAAMISRRTLLPHNEMTIISHRRFWEELTATRQRGYAIDDEEYAIGYRCLGAAVLDASHMPVAAISLMGSTSQISYEMCSSLAGELTRAADRLSAAIQGAGLSESSNAKTAASH